MFPKKIQREEHGICPKKICHIVPNHPGNMGGSREQEGKRKGHMKLHGIILIQENVQTSTRKQRDKALIQTEKVRFLHKQPVSLRIET